MPGQSEGRGARKYGLRLPQTTGMNSDTQKQNADTPLISVIVPIYNSVAFLEQALRSVCEQSYKNLQILMLDDGSTDSSASICARYCAKDSRFSLRSKANEGYGKTVNLGLRLARGDYIAILEPDDYLDADMYAAMLAADCAEGANTREGTLQKREAAQIIRCNYHIVGPGRKSRRRDNYFSLFAAHSAGHIDWRRLPCIAGSHPAIWSCLFRSDFLEAHSIRCTESPGAAFQDIGFYLRAVSCSERIQLVHRCLYFYRVHEMQSAAREMSAAILYELEQLQKYRPQNTEDQELWAGLLATKKIEALVAELQKLDFQNLFLSSLRARFGRTKALFAELPQKLELLSLPSEKAIITQKYRAIREGSLGYFLWLERRWFLRKLVKLLLKRAGLWRLAKKFRR